MGSDYGRRRTGLTSRYSPYKIVLFAGVLPFLVGLCIVLGFVNLRQGTSQPLILSSRAQESAGIVKADCPPTSPLARPSPPCNCSSELHAQSTSAQLNALAENLPQKEVHKVLSAANSADPGDQVVRVSAQPLEPLFLFVGILSGRGYRHRRLAVREAWANLAQRPGNSVCRFILSEDESTPQVQKEVEKHQDIVFLKHKTNYKSILYKTYFVFEYAVKMYDVKFILKTDDDAFVNVRALIQQLQMLCETPGCRTERVYMGKMAKESGVLLQPGHKWNNMVFYNHTGLKTYPKYMMGGGYLISGDVAAALVNINRTMQLKFTPIEDATVGFWLMSMDLRHVDHQRFYTWAAPCCFKAPVRREGQRIVTRFQLQEDMDENMCSVDPWLVLHKVDSPTKMRYIGTRVQACNSSDIDPDAVAPSLQPYVRPRDALGGNVLSGTNRRR
ncbi:hypothetical protein WJX73_005638 [Symbiochloris irregularis]|uniref:Hexosyltransferase n=1 Tax=Symbiochloris irregularis TaxID=706552 RepID=A0AAW1NY61_9CHLO